MPTVLTMKCRKQTPNHEKLRNLILRICKASHDDPYFGAVKLNKLLFLADFTAYVTLGKAITGAVYQKLELGPAPKVINHVMCQLEKQRAIAQADNTLVGGHTERRTYALKEADLKAFSGEEIAVVEDIVREFWGRTGNAMSELSHRFNGWKNTRLREEIPYCMALSEAPVLTEAEKKFGRSLQAQALAALAREVA